ncbi:hypothetical protein GWK47_035425 [Chionoecetes opilio]|uniref:Uncharacterized protein n=1 Tax=Chionoecetes opilio TaxID=41210 RepID=A0A8J4YN89_CHIOP|nr:hypothetical protein GWK47_035425 [Chionoecetes opilio]
MAELTLIVLGDTPPAGKPLESSWSHSSGQVDGQKPVFYEDVHVCEQLEYDEENCFEAGTPQPLSQDCLSPMWMSSTLAADAPANDLQFMKENDEVQETDPEIAQAVLQKLEKPQVVPDTGGCAVRSLREQGSVTKRSRTLPAKLHALRKPDSFRRGKPMFPQVTAKTTLAGLGSRESSSA